MKVKILRGVLADGKGYKAGEEADVSPQTALLLVTIGKAEIIKGQTPSEPVPSSPNESPVNRMEEAPVKRGRKSNTK